MEGEWGPTDKSSSVADDPLYLRIKENEYLQFTNSLFILMVLIDTVYKPVSVTAVYTVDMCRLLLLI